MLVEPNFWHERWANNQTSFHLGKPNPLLVDHFAALDLAKGDRVFLPLCGKTRDIGWLLAQGYPVAGAELSEIASQQLFEELETEPEVIELGGVKQYRATGLDIFVGDIFNVTQAMLGAVKAVYDRAALVALPDDMRVRYAQHLMHITETAPQLLITFDYDQRRMAGPPFSVPGDEVHRHYDTRYDVAALVSRQISGGLKGQVAATKNAWLLTPHAT